MWFSKIANTFHFQLKNENNLLALPHEEYNVPKLYKERKARIKLLEPSENFIKPTQATFILED